MDIQFDVARQGLNKLQDYITEFEKLEIALQSKIDICNDAQKMKRLLEDEQVISNCINNIISGPKSLDIMFMVAIKILKAEVNEGVIE